MSSGPSVTDPIPISRVAHRYYIYNIDHITYLRREHNIPGILVGTLPQSPQQNVFLGLPLELLSEEARLLVEKRIAYVVDDAEAHRSGLRSLSGDQKLRYKKTLQAQGQEYQRAALEQAFAKKERILNRLPENQREKLQAAIDKDRQKQNRQLRPTVVTQDLESDDGSESLFFSAAQSPTYSAGTLPANGLKSDSSSTLSRVRPQPITPTMSNPPIPVPPPLQSEVHDVSPSKQSPAFFRQDNFSPLPSVHSMSAYALYKHLHSLSYFLSSGLRFGAQYSVYPGDPLRFHAHFLARGYGWDEKFDLLSLVGGGRLGTGVKKGYLIGGQAPAENQDAEISPTEVSDEEGEVRCFCVEWAGM